MNFFRSLIVILLAFETLACDVCGGIMAPGSDGLLPGNQYHFIGIRCQFSHYRSFHDVFMSSERQQSNEYFFRSSIYGRWQIMPRIALSADVPIVYNWQRFNSKTSVHSGIGDISLRSNYLIVNRKDSSQVHLLRLGTGVKLPTGEYSRSVYETNNLFQGTGSFDVLFSTNYVYRKPKWGLLQENSYVLKTENNTGYKYGNAVSSKFSGFLLLPVQKNTKLIPSIGLEYRWNGTDRIEEYQFTSGFNAGHMLNAEVGLNYSSSKWMLMAKYSHPVIQQISSGDVVSILGNLELSINFLIQRK